MLWLTGEIELVFDGFAGRLEAHHSDGLDALQDCVVIGG